MSPDKHLSNLQTTTQNTLATSMSGKHGSNKNVILMLYFYVSTQTP